MWTLCLMSLPSRSIFLLKDHIYMMVFSLFNYIHLNRVQCLSISYAPIYFLFWSTNSSLAVWLVASLKTKLSFPDSMLESRGLLKLEIFCWKKLAIFSSWRSLAGKLAIYGRMDLVTDMATDVKRAMMPNTFRVTFPFLFFELFSFSLILKCRG